MSSYRVLIVHPDQEAGRRMASCLIAQGLAVDLAQDGRQCLAMARAQQYDGVLTEQDLGDLAAEQVLEQTRRQWPQAAVVVVSSACDPREAVRLAKLGLDDYFPGDLPIDRIARALVELLGRKRREAASSLGTAGAAQAALVGRSRLMSQVMQTIRLIAGKRSTVLITGPSGTGKDLVARLIHTLSPRAGSDMVTVNCGAIPENLLEAEFFGHVKGAFTGAVGPRVGRFEQAHGSTLFLDEIGDMPLPLQAKVLRAVQEREFQRVGSSQTVQVDVRVIAATNRDLAEKVRRGEFREDLYYRLNVVPIVMPPLAERLEDVGGLVDHFLEKICLQEAIPLKRVAAAAVERLKQYDWPGNVRQLENAIEQAVVLSGDRQELYPSDFPLPAVEPAASAASDPAVQLPPGGLDLEALLSRLELKLLEQALRAAGGNKRRAADMLRLKRTTLSAKLRAARVRSGGE